MTKQIVALRDIDLVLASSSRYRLQLLQRLTSRIQQKAPNVIEVPQQGESPKALAARLAETKANAIADSSPNALIIGSDQVASCEGEVLGKPGAFDRACAQLKMCSGRAVVFYTAVCVIDTRPQTNGRIYRANDVTRVLFRNLTDTEIHAYLEREQPYDCAGSFKCEGLGIALFERIESEDPTALIGLPLIALTRVLREAGVYVI